MPTNQFIDRASIALYLNGVNRTLSYYLMTFVNRIAYGLQMILLCNQVTVVDSQDSRL